MSNKRGIFGAPPTTHNSTTVLIVLISTTYVHVGYKPLLYSQGAIRNLLQVGAFLLIRPRHDSAPTECCFAVKSRKLVIDLVVPDTNINSPRALPILKLNSLFRLEEL